MELTDIAFIGAAIFLVLMFLKMPIGVSMAVAGFIGIWLTRGMHPALVTLGLVTYRTATSQYLSALPLFILMGILAGSGGISKGAFSTFQTWVGQFRGGLAMATTGACGAFGAVCGDSVAAAATMCSVALPEMRRYNYDDQISLGSICMGGNLGIMIPPSNAFIVYGFITQVSIGALFMAGVMPGLLLILTVCITIYFQARINPGLAPPGPRTSWMERLISLKDLWSIMVLFIIVMGGIYLGIFTPTEAGAVGAFAAFLIGIATRKLTLNGLKRTLMDTVMTSTMIFLLIIGAMILNSFLTTTEITITMGNFIQGLEINRYFILGAVLLIYVILGFFMDIYAVLVVSLPIIFPIITHLGFDPVLFGVLCILTIMIGCITPPIGVVTFAVAAIAKDVPIFKVFRGCAPYVITMCICLVILVALPQISLLLPNLMLPYR